MGYVIPPGVPYRTAMDNSLTDHGSTSFYVPVRVVDDNWCSLIIDDVTYYCASAYKVRGYAEQENGVDRFVFENIASLVTEDGLKLVAPDELRDGYAVMYQPTSEKYAEAVAEFPVTVSVLLADGRFASTTVTNIDEGVTGIIGDDLIFGIAHVIPYSSWQMFRCSVTAGHSVTIRAIKTEVGTKQTLAHKDADGNWVLNEIPNYSAESAKCSQYGSLVTVRTEAEIYSLLARFIGNMADGDTKTFSMSVEALGLSIDGGTWFVEIHRSSSTYAVVTAKRYDVTGILIKACSLNAGVFTVWVSVTPTPITPATLE
jgi:hypothetical protein